MAKSASVAVAVGAALAMSLATGCVSNLYPGGPSPHGVIQTTVTVPAQNLAVALDATAKPTKTGVSAAQAVLGLIASGDASVNAAMQSAGITKVHHVDHSVNSLLFGMWFEAKTIVYGE